MTALVDLFRCELKAFSYFVPEKKVTNFDLAQKMSTSDEWITERSGIKERRFVEGNQSTSDLAIKAVESVLQKTKLSPSDFDYIIAATLSPDYYFPGIAPLVQDKLKFPNIPALDIRVQCSAFVYAVNMADALIKTGKYKRILLVFSDVQSKFLDFTDRGRNVSVLFADGAAAVVCEAVKCQSISEIPNASNKINGVIDTLLGADGSGAELLNIAKPSSSGEHFITHLDIEQGLCHPKMEGRLVFKHAVNRMCEVAEALLEKHKIKAQDIDLLIPHQANMRISEAVREKINLPKEKVFNNIQFFGNTTSATIPLCFTQAQQQGILKPNSLVLCVAFGAGFTWGGCLVRV